MGGGDGSGGGGWGGLGSTSSDLSALGRSSIIPVQAGAVWEMLALTRAPGPMGL